MSVAGRPARVPATETVAALRQDAVRVSGHIVDVSPQSFRVAGLSPYLRLGDCVSCEGPEGPELGEVVRVEEQTATVKPFAVRHDYDRV